MDLSKLYEMQKSLDLHIEKKHNLLNEDLFSRKVLALLVELGELANETRCFKFWSLKAASEKKVILEEFVDGIHFILSLGILCDFTKVVPRINREKVSENLTDQFLILYKTVGDFRQIKSEKNYLEMLEQYLGIAATLGFSWSEIEEAYIQKNDVNYERQQSGY